MLFEFTDETKKLESLVIETELLEFARIGNLTSLFCPKAANAIN
jgi:hypothetical protein